MSTSTVFYFIECRSKPCLDLDPRSVRPEDGVGGVSGESSTFHKFYTPLRPWGVKVGSTGLLSLIDSVYHSSLRRE